MRKLALIVVGFTVLGLTSCSSGGGLETTAKFTDVGDLAPSAPVMMSDIKVGSVTGIELSGDQALVTMTIDPDAQVPEDVTAAVRRTSLLGERIVDLVVPENMPEDAPLLHDGERIQNTMSRPDLEDLVRSGTDVLEPIAASEVATLVDTGGEGFGGHGGELRQLLDNFQTIIHAYNGKRDEIRSVIAALDDFNSALAAHADAQAQSVANTAQSLGVLRDESDELGNALHALARLAIGSRSLLAAHLDEMSHFFKQMRIILGQLHADQSSLANILKWAPHHNRNTQLVEYQQFNQVLQEFVICGLNDNPKDPARRCSGGGGGGGGGGG
jgi:phospholipid/cholesterol/gamma-HCH transport system substrate-binding protein